MIRKKIRAERWALIKSGFNGFVRNPVNRRKLKGHEKILRAHVKNDIRESRKQKIRSFPSRLLTKIKNSLSIRQEQIQYTRENFFESLIPFTRQKNSGELRSDLYKTAFNSTLMFLLAFWIMYFIGQLASVFSAQFYSIPAEIYSYRTYWPLYTYSSLYNRFNLILFNFHITVFGFI